MKLKTTLFSALALMSVSLTSNAQFGMNDTTNYSSFSLEELMNVEIVAVSKKAESSFDAPLASSIITKDEIINSGATTIEEVFRLVPGFIVREESNGNYDVHMRGNDNVPPGSFSFNTENSMSLVMVDGRKVFSNINGGTFWENIPVTITDIERIEIVRGASSALYGSNAVSGVVNIITKKSPTKRFAADGNLQAGTANTKVGDFGISSTSANSKLKTRLSANYEQRDRFSNDYYNFIQGKYTPYTQLNDYNSYDPSNPRYVKVGDSKFADNQLAKKRQAINAWASYEVNDKVNFSVYGGYQGALSQTVFMETTMTPLSFRESESYSYNAIANAYGFNVQVSGNTGFQDLYKGSGVKAKYDINTIDALVEYDYVVGDLTLRPGVSYQNSKFDDTPYIEEAEGDKGYVNKLVELTNFAYYLRGDYMATEKIRLIAALRMDSYNHPGDDYLSYQFIGTYKPNKANLIRASYSKANRGPVAIDFYANYSEGAPEYGVFAQYLGDVNLKLPTTNTLELGYRSQITKQLQLDFEGYYSLTNDFTAFRSSLDISQGYQHFVTKYENLDLSSEQMGGSASLLFAPSKKMQFRVFATIQQTTLKDLSKQFKPLGIPSSTGNLNPEYELVDQKHENTPDVFGGLTGNYKPIEKLNVFMGVNFYSKQTYVNAYENSTTHYALSNSMPGYMGSGIAEIPASVRVNAKVSYKVYKDNSVFVNGRNIFGSTNPEFGLADPTGALYLVGVTINL